MREDLLDDNTCIRITKPRSYQATCVWTGRDIERGNDAIAFRDEKRSGSAALVWLGVDAADDVQTALRQFDPEALDASERGYMSGGLAPSGEVGYYTVGTDKYNCFVCSGTIPAGEGVVYFRRERRRDSCRLRCHVECTGTVADALGEVWRYTDAVLESHL